jgi:hypothetical protein
MPKKPGRRPRKITRKIKHMLMNSATEDGKGKNSEKGLID